LPIASNTDSLVEVWWDSVADIRRAFEEPRYMQIIRPDELSFGDVTGAWGVTARDSLVMERRGFAGPIKLFIFIKRSDDLTHSEFLDRWRDARDHGLMRAKMFHQFVGRFVDNEVTQDPAESLPGQKRFDLVAELWFDSLRHVGNFVADADVIAATVGEGADYTDRNQTLIYVAEEKPATAAWLRKSQLH